MNELDDIVSVLKNHGKAIILGIVAGILCATFVMFVQKPTWQAEMIIGPSERTGMPSLSSFLPQGAADAPALQYFVERIDASHATDFTILTTAVTSSKIAELFYNKYGQEFGFQSVNDARRFFDKNLSVRSYGLTPFKQLRLRYNDPAKAQAMLNHLFIIADNKIRQDKKAKATRRISYLDNQLETVRNLNHRDAIIALLKEQEQVTMMASIDQYFAATIINAPTVGLKPVSPNPLILFPGLIFIGAFIGLLISGWRAHQ